jgi:TM2 domain-containing membrane protein YozV
MLRYPQTLDFVSVHDIFPITLFLDYLTHLREIQCYITNQFSTLKSLKNSKSEILLVTKIKLLQ